ncbi:hypothetical protein DYB34_000111 [Aphanomyces astaci]|uniref:EF-hand domain-containing protein n=1 Tax=Aphanomyces astaci TaxID=112090 RepID=A0A3R6X4L9_APHAT|nr:hypothetical protein DYB34_000111 [Aphanomyces astaci]
MLTQSIRAENASGGGSSGKKSDDPVSRLIDQYAGSVGQVSFGGAVGFCAGMAVKSIGKVAAVAIGVVFIGAQMAASAGYIQIDWKKVEKDAIAAVDPNGDGKITPDDFKIWWKKFLALSKHNLPSSDVGSNNWGRDMGSRREDSSVPPLDKMDPGLDITDLDRQAKAKHVFVPRPRRVTSPELIFRGASLDRYERTR